MSEVWTVGRVLTWTADFFQQKGMDSPRLDAELLLAHVLQKKRIELYTGFDQPLKDAELTNYRELVKRRARAEPVAYLLGSQGFHDIELKVDKRVLIPRPETELLTELAVKQTKPNGVILDVGTGSGAILLSVLNARPDLRGVATDLSQDALDVARENASRLGLMDRIEWRLGESLAPVQGMRFDAIVSNPPYVATTDPLPADVVDHEPHMALFAENQGLKILLALMAGARGLLTEGGFVAVEHGKGQSDAVAEAATAGGFSVVKRHLDHAEIERVVEAHS